MHASTLYCHVSFKLSVLFSKNLSLFTRICHSVSHFVEYQKVTWFGVHMLHRAEETMLGDRPLASKGRIKKQRHYFANKDLSSQTMVFLVVEYGCKNCSIKKMNAKELVLLNCGVGEDS